MKKTIVGVTVAIAVSVFHPEISIAEAAREASYGELVEMRNMQERKLIEKLSDEDGGYYPQLGAISTSILALDSMIERKESEAYKEKDRDFFAPTR